MVQIHVDLATSMKHYLFAANFFRKIKGLVTKLTSTDAYLRDEEVLAYLLVGLPTKYDPLVTSMMNKTKSLSLDDVFAHLVPFNACQLQHMTEWQLQHSAPLPIMLVATVPLVAVAVVTKVAYKTGGE